MKYDIDFSKPHQSRKWLSLLEPHEQFGFIIQRELNLPKSLLGFSFTSNKLGLRGPSNQQAGIVCMGTSYAMGFSVNNGFNWWDQIGSDSENILNLGLPVGIAEWLKMAKSYWYGKSDTLLLLYHANWFAHEEQYSRWRQSRQSVHEFFNWKTNLTDCTLLSLRTTLGLRSHAKKYLFLESNGITYRFDLAYCTTSTNIPSELLVKLRNFAMRFTRTIVVRLPCKEEIFSKNNSHLEACNDFLMNHNAKWDALLDVLTVIPNITVHEWEPSMLQCYLPLDTHLNAKGNQELAETIRFLLN